MKDEEEAFIQTFLERDVIREMQCSSLIGSFRIRVQQENLGNKHGSIKRIYLCNSFILLLLFSRPWPRFLWETTFDGNTTISSSLHNCWQCDRGSWEDEDNFFYCELSGKEKKLWPSASYGGHKKDLSSVQLIWLSPLVCSLS